MRWAHVRASLVIWALWATVALFHSPIVRGVGATLWSEIIVAAIVLVGLGLRLLWPRGGRGAIFVVQCLAYTGLLAYLLRPWWSQLSIFVDELISYSYQAVAPLDDRPDTMIAYAAAVGALLLICELFYFVFRTPGLATIPLLGIFAVEALLPHHNANPFLLVVVAVGAAALLGVDTINRGARWHRGIEDDSGSGGDLTPTVASLGAAMVALATIFGVVVGSVLPTLNSFLPWGDGEGENQGVIAMSDPRLDLRQNLTQKDVRTALVYRTDELEGVRLQLAALDVLTDKGWTTSDKALVRGRDRLTLPAAPGMKVGGEEQQTDITIRDLRTAYLPLPYAATTVEVPGPWGYDPKSLMVHSTAKDTSEVLAGLRYKVSSTAVKPMPEELLMASVDGGPTDARHVPESLDSGVRELAERVTANATTPAEKASALQSFLRSSAFTYDLNSAPDVEGTRSIEIFLLEKRTGYCEQFASGMAAMAREVGLSSRVIIGFMPGTPQPDGSWVVTNKQMHAWTEIWFDDFGWVRFDPTPPAVSGDAPVWSPPVEVGDTTPPTTTPSPTPTPTKTSTPRPTAKPSTPQVKPPAPQPSTTGSSIPWGTILGVLGGIASVACVAAAPRWWRGQRRRSRLSAVTRTDVTWGTWREVRDLVVDYGHPWPKDTPAAAARAVKPLVSPAVAEQVSALAGTVDRQAFGPQTEQTPASDERRRRMAALVRQVEIDLRAPASRATRWRAVWLPTSLWRR